MLKKNRFIIVIFIMALLISTTVLSNFNQISAFIIKPHIVYQGDLEKRLKYPLISYNDNTYMAMRDVAPLLKKDIIWNAEDGSIIFKSYKNENNIIKNKETALNIGKAILNEYFQEKIGENSVYAVSYVGVNGIEDDNLWQISVVFENKQNADKDFVLFNPDAYVIINSQTGNFGVYNDNLAIVELRDT